MGDQIVGTDNAVIKVRAKNSDIPTGKSGGYRLLGCVANSGLRYKIPLSLINSLLYQAFLQS